MDCLFVSKILPDAESAVETERASTLRLSSCRLLRGLGFLAQLVHVLLKPLSKVVVVWVTQLSQIGFKFAFESRIKKRSNAEFSIHIGIRMIIPQISPVTILSQGRRAEHILFGSLLAELPSASGDGVSDSAKVPKNRSFPLWEWPIQPPLPK